MVLTIAEVSSNHNRDLDRSLAFVDAAAACGFGAVKFQLFRIRELFAPEVLANSAKHRDREAWELPDSFLAPIAARCRDKGIQFAATPFSLEAVELLAPHVDFYKIASYELMWDDLLRACAAQGKPVVLSTGMATMDEITHAARVLADADCRAPTLLHCTSAYPTPPGEANLAAIQTIREATGLPVGWSDHTVAPGVIHRAVHRWGASVIEMHFDLDGQGNEFGPGHCWMPDQATRLLADLAIGAGADGDGVKAPVPSEAPDRDWRADPSDGLRPLKALRARLYGGAA